MVETIKHLGIVMCVSLNDIERMCGLGKNTIYRWDKMPPSIDKVIKVADLFDVSIDYLLGRHPKRGNEAGEIDRLYSVASEDDKAVVDMALRKYKKEARTGSEVS